jgi:hypothetical protein
MIISFRLPPAAPLLPPCSPLPLPAPCELRPWAERPRGLSSSSRSMSRFVRPSARAARPASSRDWRGIDPVDGSSVAEEGRPPDGDRVPGHASDPGAPGRCAPEPDGREPEGGGGDEEGPGEAAKGAAGMSLRESPGRVPPAGY